MHELPLPPPRRPVGAGKSRNIAWHTHQRWTAEERAWKFASSVFRAHRPDHLVLGAVAVCPCLRPARDCEILRAAYAVVNVPMPGADAPRPGQPGQPDGREGAR